MAKKTKLRALLGALAQDRGCWRPKLPSRSLPSLRGEMDLDKQKQDTACGVGGSVEKGAWLGWGSSGQLPRGSE